MNDQTQLAEHKAGATPTAENAVRSNRGALIPAVDVVEDNSGITLWADLPGVTREKLELRVEGPNLFIDAEAAVPIPPEIRIQRAEISQPHFARAFTLSADFDTARIEASLKDGVLRLKIPRREEARPRRIQVSAG